MSVAYRDSSFARPNAAQATAAYASGVRVWGGYLASVVPAGPRSGGGSNLATAWTRADFATVQQAGITCLGFCSGWDDAAACGALARAWGVRPMLDVEDGIRGDGSWVDGWLAASGAGIYGLCSVHAHVAPAHIVARYPGGSVPASSWDSECPAPPGLLGWQAQGSHTDPATGLSVDAGWVDDGFVEGGTMSVDQQLTDGFKVVMHHLTQRLATGTIDPSGQQSFVDAITAGTPWNAIWDQWQSLPGSPEFVAALEQLGAQWPALMKMLADYQAGKLGGSVPVAHTHSGGETDPAVPS